jgi:hypothetical protein
VLPDVPGVLQALALNAIRQAAIEFCEKSLAWNHEHDAVTVVANVNLYDYSKPANTVVVRPLQAWINKLEPIAFKTPGQLSELLGDWRAAKGSPSFITQVRPSQFYLAPMPNRTIPLGLTLRIAVKPSRASTGLETYLYEDYLDAITAGAKARLFAMNKKPWANPGLAAECRADFDTKTREARDRVSRGYGPAKHRARPQFL